MDLTYATIPMEDETNAHLPMARDHVEEIDLEPETEDSLEELPKKFTESPLDFFLDDLPFVTPMFPLVCRYNYIGQETMANSICVNA
jgi:hypothetical protein